MKEKRHAEGEQKTNAKLARYAVAKVVKGMSVFIIIVESYVNI